MGLAYIVREHIPPRDQTSYHSSSYMDHLHPVIPANLPLILFMITTRNHICIYKELNQSK